MSPAPDTPPDCLRRGSQVRAVLGFPPIAELPARAQVSDRVFEEYLLRLARELADASHLSAARTFLLTAVSVATDVSPLVKVLEGKLAEVGVKVFTAAASEMLPPATTLMPDSAHVSGLWQQGYVAARLERLCAAYDLVLLYAEPLTSSPATENVVCCVEATVLVIECGVATGSELQQAASLLKRLGAKGVAAVAAEVQLEDADDELRSGVAALELAASQAGPTLTRDSGASIPPEYGLAGEPGQPAADSSGVMPGQARGRAADTPIPPSVRRPYAALDALVSSIRRSNTARLDASTPAAPSEPRRLDQAAAQGTASKAEAETRQPEAGTLPTLPEPRPAEGRSSAPSGQVNDLEPMFEEESRRLTAGRWDPIPTLRQPTTGWRERATPVPSTNLPAQPGGAERQRDEQAEAGTDEVARGERWSAESPAASNAGSLPEPLLTRQWGLLSRFQQERLIPARAPDVKPAGEEAKQKESGGQE